MYQATRFPRLASRTRQAYRTIIDHALRELPRHLTPGDVASWQADLLGRYSVEYVNQIVAVVRSVARRSAAITGDDGLVAVMAAAEPVPVSVKLPRCPPEDLLDKALELARDPSERAWLYLATLSGLRKGELLGLRPEDWDPESGVLQIVRQRNRRSRKNRRPHIVQVDHPEARAALQWTIDHPEAVRSKHGWHRVTKNGWIFPWGEKRLELWLERLRRHLGPEYLPRGVGWHAFRHLGATAVAKAGGDQWEVLRWLGDTDPAMAATYVEMARARSAVPQSKAASHLLKRRRRRAAKRIEDSPARCRNTGRGMQRPSRKGRPYPEEENEQKTQPPTARSPGRAT